MPLVSFSSGQVIKSADVNSNFGLCVLTDTSRTITVTHTFSASQTFSGGASFGAAITSDLIFTDATYDIGKSAATRPRDVFTSRNVNVGGTLTLGGNVVSDLLFTDATYDIGKSGATRPRDGFFSRNVNIAGTLTLPGGSGTLTFSTSGTAVSNLIWTNAGGGLVVGIEGAAGATLAGGSSAYAAVFNQQGGNSMQWATVNIVRLTLNSSGSLVFATAASKIIPGATSLSFRDNGDTNNNLLVTDVGAVTLRNTLTGTALTMTGTFLYGALGSLRTPTSVSGIAAVATAIYTKNGGGSAVTVGVQLTVWGTDGAGAIFLDVVGEYNGTNIVAVTSTTLAGAPAARTYTTGAGGIIKLTMAAGTYTVKLSAIELS